MELLEKMTGAFQRLDTVRGEGFAVRDGGFPGGDGMAKDLQSGMKDSWAEMESKVWKEVEARQRNLELRDWDF